MDCDTYCLPDDCYTITVGGGAWQNEVDWNITVNGGAPVASATAPNGIVTNQDVPINSICLFFWLSIKHGCG